MVTTAPIVCSQWRMKCSLMFLMKYFMMLQRWVHNWRTMYVTEYCKLPDVVRIRLLSVAALTLLCLLFLIIIRYCVISSQYCNVVQQSGVYKVSSVQINFVLYNLLLKVSICMLSVLNWNTWEVVKLRVSIWTVVLILFLNLIHGWFFVVVFFCSYCMPDDLPRSCIF